MPEIANETERSTSKSSFMGIRAPVMRHKPQERHRLYSVAEMTVRSVRGAFDFAVSEFKTPNSPPHLNPAIE